MIWFFKRGRERAVFEVRQGSGHFVTLASIGAHQVSPTAAVYCATKFAVRAISDGLRQESSTIRVTCVNPGVVESELASTITHAETRAFMDTYRAIALKPADIARNCSSVEYMRETMSL